MIRIGIYECVLPNIYTNADQYKVISGKIDKILVGKFKFFCLLLYVIGNLIKLKEKFEGALSLTLKL
jgi:hypothetical protein